MRVLRVAVVVSTLVMLSTLALAQQYSFTAIADLNDYAGYFEPATLTNDGAVLFAPAMKTGMEGVQLWRAGVLTTIAAGLQPAPGGGFYGNTLSPIQMNDNRTAAFMMTRDGTNLPNPLGINAGVYRWNAKTGTVPVLLPGTPVPGGSVFIGTGFVVGINNKGDIYIPGMICTSVATSFGAAPCPDGSAKVISYGVYKADPRGKITAVVLPGDPAPGGGYFDYAHGPAVNSRGDLAFTAHLFSDPCPPGCWDSLYLKRSPSGVVVAVAPFNGPSPVAGRTYGAAYSAMLNSVGDLVFIADTSVAHDFTELGVFLYTQGTTIAIAKLGDPMPGGGAFAGTGYFNQNVAMNNAGDIAFVATLTDGTQALYLWRHGVLSLVAKTGTDTGYGVIANLDDFGTSNASTQVSISNNGMILFGAKFRGGGGAMLIATKK